MLPCFEGVAVTVPAYYHTVQIEKLEIKKLTPQGRELSNLRRHNPNA